MIGHLFTLEPFLLVSDTASSEEFSYLSIQHLIFLQHLGCY